MLHKSLGLSPDTIMYDLEDSVAAHKKHEARLTLSAFLSPDAAPSPSSSCAFQNTKIKPEIAVRINPPSTPHALADLTELLKHGADNIDAIVVPKVDSTADLQFVTDVLRQLLPDRHPSSPSSSAGRKSPIKILALIESARSITNLREICTASPYLDGLIFAAEDFSLSLSLTRTPSLTEMLFARQSLVTYANAYSLPSIVDLVHVGFSKHPVGSKENDNDQATVSLLNECQGGREMGFNGKQCIHPNQVALVQNAFSPGEKEVEWAVRIVVGDEKASKAGRGAWTMDGKMIDVPVVGRAKSIVERAERCGIDVENLRKKWSGQNAD